MAKSIPTRAEVRFPSHGTDLAAYLYRPAGTDGDVPCVVMAHGFSATRDDRLPAFAERFQQAGLAVLVFDYRYFGASDGEPRQLLDVGKQHEDWRTAVAYARGLDGVDPERIALWGSSFSGGHVVATAAADPRIAAVVAQAPYTDGIPTLALVPPKNMVLLTAAGVRDKAGSLLGRKPHYIPAVAEPGGFGVMSAPEAVPGFEAIAGPDSNWRNEVAGRLMLTMALYRPARLASKLRMPLLVAVCDDDQITPPKEAVKMAHRAPNSELVRYPIGHFGIYVGEWFERAVADQTDFLTRHLLGTEPERGGASVPPTATEQPVAGD